MMNKQDFYYTIKRMYEKETGKHWSINDFSTQPTEEYMEWLEERLFDNWVKINELRGVTI
jgi:hypothetical protein